MADETGFKNIRHLCLQLKPILGARVDQIYEGYLAEDDEGKKQIEQYLQLLAAKYIPQELGQSETVLLPPSEKQAAGEYPIGQVYYAGRKRDE